MNTVNINKIITPSEILYSEILYVNNLSLWKKIFWINKINMF